MPGRLPGKVQTPKTSGQKQSINRGTQDELEIIGLIITSNVGLRTLVFDRLKQAKAREKSRAEIRKARGGSDDKAS